MPEDRAFRALLVDYGGVLTTSMVASIGQFCLATGVQPDALRSLLAGAYGGTEAAAGAGTTAEAGPGEGSDGIGALVPALETGRLSVEEFDLRLAEALSVGLPAPLEPAGLSARLFAALRPDDRMIAAVRSARRQGVKTGLISNTWGPVASAEGLADLFDAEVRSGEEGLRKPDPEIYRVAARRVGVAPDACVFVDDIPANVQAARAVGMWGLLHRDPAITIPKLEALLDISLS